MESILTLLKTPRTYVRDGCAKIGTFSHGIPGKIASSMLIKHMNIAAFTIGIRRDGSRVDRVGRRETV